MTNRLLHRPDPIVVGDETDLSRLLDAATSAPIRLERNGIVYRLEREENDIWADYDPEKVREGLRLYAGSWSDMDAEALKAYVYRGREEGTRPLDRP
jgi:hypothetical protein